MTYSFQFPKRILASLYASLKLAYFHERPARLEIQKLVYFHV
jgi:hypothetical protein